jgi:hypothetical protein
MKIQSKFKDYYDHVGHLYGEDPDVVYARGRVEPVTADELFKYTPDRGRYGHILGGRSSRVGLHDLMEREDEKTGKRYAMELIFAAELAFAVVEVNTPGRPHSGEEIWTSAYQALDLPMLKWLTNNKYKPWLWEKKNALEWDVFLEALATFRKEKIEPLQVRLKAPVLHVTVEGVVEKVPVLKDFGIASLVPPEQLWQQIYSFFVNRLRHNPDKAVPVQLDNNRRVEKAGFDLKTSFRNPINPKTKR